jgi:hypothetical protein
MLLANSSNFALGLFSGWAMTLTLPIRSRSSFTDVASVMVNVLSDVNLKIPCRPLSG